MGNRDMLLSLNNDTFQALKEDFDAILNKTLSKMKKKETDEATLTLKVSIGLSDEMVLDENGDEIAITKPSFKHEINSVMQVKEKKTGAMSGEYELVYDEKEGKFVMRKIVDNQTSFFDEDGELKEEYVDADESDDEEPTTPMIEAPADENITPFKWFSQFAGETVKVVGKDDGYAVVNDDDVVLLSSNEEPTSVYYAPAALLEEHFGHTLTVVFTNTDTIAVYCDDCKEALYEIKDIEIQETDDDGYAEAEEIVDENTRPDEDEDYGYDEPEFDEEDDE